jgi:hypothetical protein
MDILHIERQGQLMNMWERYHIYKLSSNKLQLNDTYTDTHNPIFNLIINHCNWKINTTPTSLHTPTTTKNNSIHIVPDIHLSAPTDEHTT